MRTLRCLVFAVSALASAAGASALLGACASDEEVSLAPPEVANAVPGQDAAGADADAEAGPCTADDCEYFPEACAADVLCPSGPFDPVNPAVGMDWRTRINVVRGRSASDVWIAGTVGTVAHFDGTSWTQSETGTQESLRELWLPGAGEISFRSLAKVYARGLDAGDADASVSAGGWSLREVAPTATFGGQLGPVWAAPGADSLWVATGTRFWRLELTAGGTFEGARSISSSVCGARSCGNPRSLHGLSAKTVSLWVVGELGLAMRVTDADGETPTVTSLNTQTWDGLTGVWAASDTDVWAVGGTGTIRHYTGDGLRWDVVSDVPTGEHLNAVWGTSPSDVWAVGNAGVVLHYDGIRWSRVKVAGLGARRPDLYTVWSPGAGHVWIGGYGVVLALGGKP
ncbi:MAG: hypothetical protein BGO98_27025 [Myxococcales bacterium 68-20]|nr:MAG: hypothetical protein BGO98_27025 [Myxococcales bacterium 68-20]